MVNRLGEAQCGTPRMSMHKDQLHVTTEMVQQLIHEQFPRWHGLEVLEVHSEGTVNAIFRIGRALAARFPLRAGDPKAVAAELLSEAVASKELANHTTVPTPVAVGLGKPGAGYPQSWAIQTWLPGSTATVNDPGESTEFAVDLARFITELRSIDLDGRTFSGDNRGGDIARHDEWMQKCFDMSESLLDVDKMRTMWAHYRALPDAATQAMTHGDLIPGNVLVAKGRLVGVLDVGGFGPSDSALDLVSAWHLLDEHPRSVLRNEMRCSDLEWERGKAWAFEQAMGLVWYYRESNPPMSALGQRTLERLSATT